MKPAKVGAALSPAVASWQQPLANSQIPLPLRRGSSKSDRSQESDTADADSLCKDRSTSSRRSSSDRTNAKSSSSILGSTSFCCASGQKDDNVSETKVPARPLKKKPPKNASSKRETDKNGAETANLNGSKKTVAALKSKSAKVENDNVRERSREKSRQGLESPVTRHSMPAAALLPQSSKKSTFRANVRLPDSKKNSTERSQANGTEFEKGTNDFVRDSKYTDVIREIQKDPGETLANNLMSKTTESNKLYGKVTNVGILAKSDEMDPSTRVRLLDDLPGTVPDKTVNITGPDVVSNADIKINNVHDEQTMTSDLMKNSTTATVMVKSCDTDDLDCPCCENVQPITDELFVSKECRDRENKVASSLDWLKYSLTSSTESCGDTTKDNKVNDLEAEVRSLQCELQNEKENLRNQRQRVLELEKEAKAVEQLKQELIKEKKLRNETEKKLLEILGKDHINAEEETCAVAPALPRSPSKSESSRPDVESSPLLLGYESRVRRYQTYISKLEKDNAMLVGEISKLKDLSPCSQGEQAKLLLAKLDQLERNNQQQQLEYESCLDDVASKLVHTLLRQKRLEEECQMLQERVEQLELENAELLRKLNASKESENCRNTCCDVGSGSAHELKSSTSGSPLSCRVTLASGDDAAGADTSKGTVSGPDVGSSSLPTSPNSAVGVVSSSPGDKGASTSKIPAFGPSKSSPSRKRTKLEPPSGATGKQRHQRIPTVHDGATSSEESSPPPPPPSLSKIASPSRLSPCASSPKSDLAKPQSTNQNDPAENKHSGAKRKRSSAKHGNLAEGYSPEPKSPSKSQHVRWDTKVKRHTTLENVSECYPTFPKTAAILPMPSLKPEDNPPQQVQEVWNFTFTVDSMPLVNSLKCSSPWKNDGNKGDDLLPADGKDLVDPDDPLGKSLSPTREVDRSVSIDGIHRTRDEGYSTMSSDQQQDSAADTTVSEHEEPSATYMPAQNGSSKFVSDDSVTECLDGSMTSSSDSGFGPLQQIALSRHIRRLVDLPANRKISDSSASGATSPVTIEKDVVSTSGTLSYNKERSHCKTNATITVHPISTTKSSSESPFFGSPFTDLGKDIKDVSTESHFTNNKPNQPSSSMHQSTTSSECHSTCVQSFSNVNFISQTTHNICDENNPNCTLQSKRKSSFVVDDEYDGCQDDQELQDERVETAEKATLTEPEEAMWREKALAHFIDESIWSLYSSESDTQMRFLSGSASREISPFDNIATSGRNTPPKIVITPENNSNAQNSSMSRNGVMFVDASTKQTDFSSSLREGIDALVKESADIRVHSSPRTLERVASDSVLCLKDAFHELEDSMRPGLKMTRAFKTSTNIPFFTHFSASDIRNLNVPLPCQETVTSPEILLNLEKTMLQTNYVWPTSINPSGSSSVCSLQSSNSYHLVSDETDDVDAMRQPSRKGSQDPDLNSASDAEYENLEHKDFVERWIQKEITEKTSPAFVHGPRQAQAEEPVFRTRKSYPVMNLQSDAVATLSALKILSAKCASLANGESGDVGENDDIRLKNSSSPAPELQCFKRASCFGGEYPEEMSGSSASSLVYPIIFTCENIEDDCEASPNFNELEVDLELLDADLKEFNGEFYKLCNVGSSLSLDRSMPVMLAKKDNNNTQQPQQQQQQPELPFHKPYSQPPPPTRCKLPKKQISPVKRLPRRTEYLPSPEVPPKPTGYVKPVRPVTLTFCDVPNHSNFKAYPKKDNVQSSNNGCEGSKSKLANCKKLELSPQKPGAKAPKPRSKSSARAKSNSMVDCSPTAPSAAVDNRSYEDKSCLPVNQNQEKSSTECDVQQPTKPENDTSNLLLLSPRQVQNRALQVQSSIQQRDREQDAVSKRHHWRKERRSFKQHADAKEGCGTAWVHLHADPSLSDPKVRASFLDSMVETISSSESSSDEEDGQCVRPVVQSSSHLQRLCREKRQRIKASRGEDFLSSSPRHRASVIDRQSIYYRFGEQERAAMACFDFLEEIPTSSSEPGSLETFQRRLATPPSELDTSRNCPMKERVNLVSPCASEAATAAAANNSTSGGGRSRASSFGSKLRVPVMWNKPLSHNMSSSTLNSQDCEILDHISLSDSCAESYSSTPDSFEDAT